MTLQASGEIDIEDINVELGRAAGAAFSFDGAEERALAGVPSGQISLSDFYGKQNFTVSFPLQPYTVDDFTASGGNPPEAQCGFRFKPDRTVWQLNTTADTETEIDTWLNVVPASPGLFEILCTHVSGSEVPTNEGVWLTMDVDRDFTIDADGGLSSTDSETSVGTFQIRFNGGAVLATANYDMTAESEHTED